MIVRFLSLYPGDADAVEGAAGSGRGEHRLAGLRPVLIVLGLLVEGESVVALPDLIEGEFGRVVLVLKGVEADVPGFLHRSEMVLAGYVGESLDALRLDVKIYEKDLHFGSSCVFRVYLLVYVTVMVLMFLVSVTLSFTSLDKPVQVEPLRVPTEALLKLAPVVTISVIT